MKKILILTVTAGNGHNSCAKAMKRKLESTGEELEVKIVDLLKEYSTPMNVWTVDKGYNIAVGKLKGAYNFFYNVYKKSKPSKRYKCAAQGVATSTLKGLLKEISEFKPDVIFCTHFYAGVAITDLKLVYDLPCKSVITSLDYVNSPFWEACIGVDYFNVPNKDFVKESISEGFTEDQLLTFGIPADERSLTKIEKWQAREALDLQKDMFTIMVMFGGGHWGGGFKIFKNLIKILEKRGEAVQVVMINGKNKKGYDKIQKMTFKENVRVINVGFTDKVPLYMSASDIIVNKCGGVSGTEILNQGLPMLSTETLPAQELYNLAYLKNKGVALSFRNKRQLKDNLFDLMNNPLRRERMSQRALELRTEGTEKLSQFILDLPNADYSDFSEKQINFSGISKKVKKAMKKAHKEEKKKEKNK